MTSTLRAYTDAINCLTEESVKCSPRSWRRATLSIQCDGDAITYDLKSDDSPDKAIVSSTLRDQISELYKRMKDSGCVWKQAYLSWWDEDNNVKFKIGFVYDKADVNL